MSDFEKWKPVFVLNQLYPKRSFKKEWHLANKRIIFEHRSADNLWGRFGGGWQWELGFKASSGFHSVIISLLVCSLMIYQKETK